MVLPKGSSSEQSSKGLNGFDDDGGDGGGAEGSTDGSKVVPTEVQSWSEKGSSGCEGKKLLCVAGFGLGEARGVGMESNGSSGKAAN